jgi:putative DNA methylase
MRKKLIEVALPLEAINAAAAREKSIRHGHPSTLHLWWARRPLAACRAVLFASLVDDPDSDPRYRRADGTVDEERASAKRAELFNLIAELVKWENSNNPRVLNAARQEIARSVASQKVEAGELAKNAEAVPGATAWDFITRQTGPEAVNAFLVKHAPPVLDPFCGGGSIPLEAQRLGLVAHASDLNPVAVLITKALIEIPPKFAGRPPVNPGAERRTAWSGAQGLAEDVRFFGNWMRDEAEKRIGHLYPKVKVTTEMAKDRPDLEHYVGEELTPIAWLWTRTVKCPNPACGRRMPLLSTFVLSSKAGRQAYIHPILTGDRIHFEVHRTALASLGDPKKGYKRGMSGIFQCAFCGSVTTRDYVAEEGCAGHIGVEKTAVVLQAGNQRVYLSAGEAEEPTPPQIDPSGFEAELAPNPRDVWCRNFGLLKPTDLFTARQFVTLAMLSSLVATVRDVVIRRPA